MKIALAADHAGLEFKNKVKDLLKKMGHEVIDLGTDTKDSVDYPDYGLKAARLVQSGSATRGVTVCYSGNGMNIAVNKVKGIRSGLALNKDMAYLTRFHNDANMLALSQKFTPESELESILKTFLETPFEGGRHVRRIEKIMGEEKKEKQN
jgi:ribose 5-phosphate isomerase B